MTAALFAVCFFVYARSVVAAAASGGAVAYLMLALYSYVFVWLGDYCGERYGLSRIRRIGLGIAFSVLGAVTLVILEGVLSALAMNWVAAVSVSLGALLLIADITGIMRAL